MHRTLNRSDPMAELILVFRLCVTWLLTGAGTNASQRPLKLHLVTSAVFLLRLYLQCLDVSA